MIYLSGSKSPPSITTYLDSREIGLLDTPRSFYAVEPGWAWAADNGCFNSRTYLGDDVWYEWLVNHGNKEGCLFASAPDVVGNWRATHERSAAWLPKIRAAGYPAALVLQDGVRPAYVPWDDLDAVFIGGSTDWKLNGSPELIHEALKRGKHVHAGRVNSWSRYWFFARLGVHSADGTHLAFMPTEGRLQEVLRWRESYEGWRRRYEEGGRLAEGAGQGEAAVEEHGAGRGA